MTQYSINIISVTIAFYALIGIPYGIYASKNNEKWDKIKLIKYSLFLSLLIVLTSSAIIHFLPEEVNKVENNKVSRLDSLNTSVDSTKTSPSESSVNINKDSTIMGNPIKEAQIEEVPLQRANTEYEVAQPILEPTETSPTSYSDVRRNVKITISKCSKQGDNIILSLLYENIGSKDLENYLIRGIRNNMTDQNGNLYDSNFISIANVSSNNTWRGENYKLVKGTTVAGEVHFFIGNRNVTKLNSLFLVSGHQFFNIPVN